MFKPAAPSITIVTARILFSQLQNQQLVARYFGLAPDFVERFLNQDRHAYYKKMLIPKRSRRRTGFRTVYKTTDRMLRNVHKQLAVAVQSAFVPAEGAHGFIKNRSIVTNSLPHLGASIVLRLDIRDFFDSIRTETITKAFVSLGAGHDGAALLAEFATLDGHLVQGASSSPSISNLVCTGLDQELAAVALAHGAVFTRYSDDLTFSGRSVPTPQAIERVLMREGLVLAWDKVRHQRKGRFQYVTGVSVSYPTSPRAPRRFKRWLRTVVNASKAHGLNALLERFDNPYRQSYEVSRIDGSIAYLYAIEPKLAAKLDLLWQAALEESGREVTRPKARYVPKS